MTIFERIAKGLPVNVVPLAEQVGMAPTTLYRAIERGEIPATKIGTRMTVPAHVARRLLCLPEPPTSP